MAQKIINIPGIGEVILQKRRGAKNIRLSITHEGTPKVSLPYWTPFKVGEAFAQSKTSWIIKHREGRGRHSFVPNSRIGKAHRLVFVAEKREKITSRVTLNEIVIRLPLGTDLLSELAQNAVHKAAHRALKNEAEKLLPIRLEVLANEHGFKFRSVSIKKLKTRWGSCSSNADIALNSYLMQLPWELIDYVLLHELLHTRIMAHGKPFWAELNKYVTDLADKRKTIRTHRPALMPQA